MFRKWFFGLVIVVLAFVALTVTVFAQEDFVPGIYPIEADEEGGEVLIYADPLLEDETTVVIPDGYLLFVASSDGVVAEVNYYVEGDLVERHGFIPADNVGLERAFEETEEFTPTSTLMPTSTLIPTSTPMPTSTALVPTATAIIPTPTAASTEMERNLPAGWTEIEVADLPEPAGYPELRSDPQRNQYSNGVERMTELTVNQSADNVEWAFMFGDTANIPVPGVGAVGEVEKCYLVLFAAPIVFDTQPTDGEYGMIHWPNRSAHELYQVWPSANPMLWLAQKHADQAASYPDTCGKDTDILLFTGDAVAQAQMLAQTELDGWTHNPMLGTADNSYIGWLAFQSILSPGAHTVAEDSALLAFGGTGLVNGTTIGLPNDCFLVVAGPGTQVEFDFDDGKIEIHKVDTSFDAMDWATEKAMALAASNPDTCGLGVDVWIAPEASSAGG